MKVSVQFHLLRLVNHILHDPLHSFEFWAHFRACPSRCDGLVQTCLLVRVCQKSISDCLGALGLSLGFELYGCKADVRVLQYIRRSQ